MAIAPKFGLIRLGSVTVAASFLQGDHPKFLCRKVPLTVFFVFILLSMKKRQMCCGCILTLLLKIHIYFCVNLINYCGIENVYI